MAMRASVVFASGPSSFVNYFVSAFAYLPYDSLVEENFGRKNRT